MWLHAEFAEATGRDQRVCGGPHSDAAVRMHLIGQIAEMQRVLQVEVQRTAWTQLHAEFAAATPASSVSAADLTWALQCVRSRAFSGPYGGVPSVP